MSGVEESGRCGDEVGGWYPGRAGGGTEVEAEDATIRNLNPVLTCTRVGILPNDPRQLLAGTDELRRGRDGSVSLSVPALIEPVASEGSLGRKEATTQPHDRRVLVGRSERTAVPMVLHMVPKLANQFRRL